MYVYVFHRFEDTDISEAVNAYNEKSPFPEQKEWRREAVLVDREGHKLDNVKVSALDTFGTPIPDAIISSEGIWHSLYGTTEVEAYNRWMMQLMMAQRDRGMYITSLHFVPA